MTFCFQTMSFNFFQTVCIFGICGACRTDEFTRINLEDVEKHGNLFLVRINQTKTKIPRSFTINGGFAGIVQKFIDLRPVDMQPTDVGSALNSLLVKTSFQTCRVELRCICLCQNQSGTQVRFM